MAPTKKADRPTERLNDLDKAPRIAKMREDGKTWAEISEKLKMTAGRAQFVLTASQVRPKDRIKFTDDEDLGKKIVKARDKDNLSWPLIAARTGVTEGRCKDIYRRVKSGKPAGVRRGRKPSTNGTGAKGRERTSVKAARPKAKATRTRRGAAKRRKSTAKATDPSAT